MATSARLSARILAPALVAALLAGPAPAGGLPAPGADHPAAFHVPVPLERALPNGLRVAVFPDHRLPLVQMQLLIPAGMAQEPAGTPGVATLVATLLRGGTSSRTAAMLAADVDRLGGALAGSTARDFSTVNATFLAADLDAGLELLADAVVNSVFPADELDRVRRQLAGRLFQAQQSPAALADDRLWEAAFGGHPYARPPLGSLAALERLDWDAVRAFHRDFYRPDRALLVIAGDVDPAAAFAAAADRFGNWAGRAAAAPAPPAPVSPVTPRIRLVDRPELARSEIRVGLVCPPRTHADALALQLADELLVGQGPSSRLGRSLQAAGLEPGELRGSYANLKDAGLLNVGAAVGHGSVAGFVARVRDELARLAAPPDGAELEAARQVLTGGFPLQFQTPAALLARWSGADFYGLGDTWLDGYAAAMGAVTPAQVAGAAGRWLDPARMVVVAVGPAATLRPALEPFGAVEVVDAATVAGAPPPPPPAPAPPDAAQLRRGRQLLDRAMAAHGGLARLRRLKDSSVEGTMIMQIGGNDAELSLQLLRKEPDRMRYSTRAAQLQNGQVLNGARGWTYLGVGDSLEVHDMDSVGVAALRAAFRADVVHALLGAAAPGSQVAARGPGRADGREVEVLEVVRRTAANTVERTLLHLDARTHLLAAEDFAEDPARPGTFLVRRVYRDYRAVSGVQWPFYEERLRGGTKTMSIMLGRVTLDSGLSDAWFERPERPAESGPLR
jgi:predicted Zn-dependent peptidase